MPSSRRRPPLACEQCRRRKIGCDRQSPCSNCIRYGRSSCTYVPITHTRKVVHYIQTIDFGSSSAAPSPSSSDASCGQPAQEPSEAVQALTNRVRQLEHVLEEFLGVPECAATPQDPAIHGRFLKTRFYGYSHRSNFCESKFRDLLLLLYQLNATEGSEIRVFHDKCARLDRAIKMQNLPATKPHVGVSELVPSRPIADRLVAAYFRTFESVYRIIHRPSFQRLYDRFWECRPADQTFAIQLILILSIGSVFEPGHTSRKSITEWIYVAQQWLDSPSDQPRLHLEAIQVHCLLLIARQATAVDGENLWISTGHLLTSAMHLGLHIDPRHLIQPSPFHAEHRRRLWATVLELIIQSSMDSGGVPLIGDYDCAPPRNLNDDQIENDILPADAKEFTDTSVQIALLRSLPLRLRIARTVNNFRSGLSYEETLRFSTELLDIYREAAIVLQPADSSRQSTPFQRKLYDLMTQRFLLVLHDRFFMQAKSNPSYSYSRKLALKASFHILNLSSPTDSCDYTSLSLSGAAGFRDIPMQAAGELSDELLSRVSTDSSTRSASGLVKNNDDLRGPLDAFLSTTLTRLQISETNVKTYVIFRCFLAQVDAIQAGQGVDVNDVIRETLRDGLATAAGILEAVAGSSSQAADTLSNNTNHNELANDPDDWILNDNVTGDIDSWLLGYG